MLIPNLLDWLAAYKASVPTKTSSSKVTSPVSVPPESGKYKPA